jgi:hypothetical protein
MPIERSSSAVASAPPTRSVQRLTKRIRGRRLQPPPSPPSRTKWTRLVPLPVLTGRVSSLFTQVQRYQKETLRHADARLLLIG